VNDDGKKGLEVFYCFVENWRVGQYLFTLSNVAMAKSLVAGIQKWIDERESQVQEIREILNRPEKKAERPRLLGP
jgi:ferritin-like metal-binding protein YciE